MGQTEYEIFIVLASLILLIFIGGIIVFIIQYHKKKLQDQQEQHKIAQEHAREVLHIKLEIQEKTMEDIGRELHDNIGQQLVLAHYYTDQLNAISDKPEIQEQSATIGEIINNSLADIRSLSKSLQKAEDMGELEDLVKKQCARINALHKCTATCTFNGDELDMSGSIKNFILRIIQEFLQNSLKHSGCKNITIGFNYAQGLHIQLKDDGVGFDMKQAIERRDGIGLTNMKKRAEMIGADFKQKSAQGQGTMLALFIPADKLNVS